MRSSSPGSAGCLWQCTVTQNHDVKLQMGGTAPPPLHEYYTAVPRCHGSASLEGREVQHSNGITVTSHTASQLSGIAPRYSHRLLLPGTDASSQPGAYVTARGHARERHHGGLSHDATGGKPGFRGLPRRHLGAGLPRRSRRVPSSSPVVPRPPSPAEQHSTAARAPALPKPSTVGAKNIASSSGCAVTSNARTPSARAAAAAALPLRAGPAPPAA